MITPRLSILPMLVVAGCVATVHHALPPRPLPNNAAPAKPVWQARKVVVDAVAVPGGRLHTVKPGETGIAIARAYGVDWGRIVAANALKPPYTLEIGDRLLLPTLRQVAAMSMEDRARAFKIGIDDIITGGEPATAIPKPAAKPVTKPDAQLTQPTGDTPVFRWPTDGRIISGFGAKPGGRFNDGVNLRASAGSPVRAAGDGVVAYAGDAIVGFGNLILIKHAGNWVTAYGHAEALLVVRGARVRQGDVIARAGQTGAVTEPQVHFELRHGRTPIDPEKVIGGR